MAIVLYGVNASPFVRKVRVVLAEKNVPHEREDVIPVNVSAEYKKISPLGKIPALRDGDRALCDSSVICAYLERTHPEPALYPADPYEYARALWFEEYADTALVNVSGPKIFFQRIVAPRFFNQQTDEATVQKAIDEELPPLFDYLESQLGDGNTLVGKRFSIGDIGIGSQFVNLRHAGVGVDTKRWPKLARYVAAVHERPSFKALIDEERPIFSLSA
jgi:glutathione S-transferase